jgi:hypothetical protein
VIVRFLHASILGDASRAMHGGMRLSQNILASARVASARVDVVMGVADHSSSLGAGRLGIAMKHEHSRARVVSAGRRGGA